MPSTVPGTQFQVYNLFVHTFDKYLLNSECLPGTILRAGDIVAYQKDKISAFLELSSCRRKQIKNKLTSQIKTSKPMNYKGLLIMGAEENGKDTNNDCRGCVI